MANGRTNCKGNHCHSAPATCQRGVWLSVAQFSDFSREASKQDFDVKTKNTMKAKNNPTGHKSGHRSVPLLEATEVPWAGRIPNSNPETKYGPKLPCKYGCGLCVKYLFLRLIL